MDSFLSQLAQSVPAAQTLEQLTRPLLDIVGRLTGLESAYLTTVDSEAGTQNVRYASNRDERFVIPEGLTVPWADTLCKRALEEGRACTTDVPARWGDSVAARALGITTYVSAPVRTEAGALLGTLCAASAGAHEMSPEVQSVLALFSKLIGSFIERERLVEQLSVANAQLMAFALTDALTGLPNRRALVDELERMLARAARDGRCVLVGLVDMDGFKGINDTYGHDGGDEFLKEAARRLSGSLRAGDVLGRIGGDEFLIVGPGPHIGRAGNEPGLPVDGCPIRQAERAMQQRAAASTVGLFELTHARLQYGGASVGVAAVEPASADAACAMRLADARMYEAKRERRAAAPAATLPVPFV